MHETKKCEHQDDRIRVDKILTMTCAKPTCQSVIGRFVHIGTILQPSAMTIQYGPNDDYFKRIDNSLGSCDDILLSERREGG